MGPCTHRFLGVLFLAGVVMTFSGCSLERWLVSQYGNLQGEWHDKADLQKGAVLTFFGDGTYTYDLTGDGKRDVWGEYSKANAMIIFRDKASAVNPDCTQPGVYSYTVDRLFNMQLKVLVDPCEARAASLLKNWYRVNETNRAVVFPVEEPPVTTNFGWK